GPLPRPRHAHDAALTQWSAGPVAGWRRPVPARPGRLAEGRSPLPRPPRSCQPEDETALPERSEQLRVRRRPALSRRQPFPDAPREPQRPAHLLPPLGRRRRPESADPLSGPSAAAAGDQEAAGHLQTGRRRAALLYPLLAAGLSARPATADGVVG